MTLKYYTSSDVPTSIKHVCKMDHQRCNTTYTTLEYKNKTYYIVSSTSSKNEIKQEFLIQFQIKKTVRNILANIPEIQIDFQEYDGEHGVLNNENYEVNIKNHTIRFSLYINDCKDIENIRVFSDTEWLAIQDPELDKIKRKLIKQINY
jgi:ribosomal protein L23